jgi:hypothetical protein
MSGQVVRYDSFYFHVFLWENIFYFGAEKKNLFLFSGGQVSGSAGA